MDFTDYDLGWLRAGVGVEVILSGTEANVRLVDSANFSSYRSGLSHRYWGGHYSRSPIYLTVPHDGHWHVVIDLGGYGGSVRSSVRVLSGVR